MTYFYEFELILAGIILLSAMAFAGIKIWLKRKDDTPKETVSDNEETQNHEV